MTILKTILATLTAYLLTFIATAPGLQIKGTAIGLKDSTWIYLQAQSPKRMLDSCMVMGGKFKLAGKLNGPVEQAVIHTARYTNYVFFWAESKPMEIILENGAFKKGVIKGSVTEDEDHSFEKAKSPITVKNDSLSKLLDKETNAEAKKLLRSQLLTVQLQDRKFDINYVKAHPNSIISAYILSVYCSTWDKETVKALYANLNPALKKSEFGISVNEFLTLNKNLKLGDQYADFEQATAGGKKIKLSDIKGKYVLLEFWASWCGPCRESNPALVKTYNQYKDKGFAILGVSLDDNKVSWLKAIKDDGLPWANVSELNGDKNKAGLIYGINAIPNNFLIDESGKIIARNLRDAALDKKLKELMP
ncbi:redoxin domain-containing protein [Mucilaginibacter terrae]|uniref:redoxin domain-containing protein n=1 Tax=Mucilaginibacter terrae TaxID=1955052 RepID=UPI0036448D9F